ncbi:MAG: valine--tRNA ligase [Deltaproteobacteria bacterium]|jgi:valyl-tRNA synthetase|nr:valine--tRNA ligase [Deltaproteobacteria bacterium]
MCSTSETLNKAFDHLEAEARIYAHWEKNNLFRADPDAPGDPFVIVIPPPNVTGNLHMGHALDNTLQDILIRYHRMKGDNTLWVPGTDHAGIATQAVVERYLSTLNLSRLEMGREKFLERVWQWKEEFGGKIIEQLKRLGSSCDWSRERFTMDPGLSKAVREVFVSLYEEGLIYRGDYVINWCPHCLTAISDIEVEHQEQNDSLYYIIYQGTSGGPSVTVATTRPETLFGDTAVAVHPDDPRYQGENLQVIVPFTGRAVPIIKDSYVDREFGTGALKVTPAHDANDWRIGQRHNLPVIVAIDKKGFLTSAAGKYEGEDRFEARKNVLEDLKNAGLLEKVEPLTHAVGVCYRCRTVIEPLLSKQWFVSTKSLAQSASQSVKDGRTTIVPESWEKTFFDWMDGIRDWCVSRQLWWGHQIPAWYCDSCGKTTVSRKDVEICPYCAGKLLRDPDVLDTWFSSGLWPFSTLGWPDKTKDLERYYPTTVLVTGFDIIFFWVARMMMFGLKMMGQVPFYTVVLHPLVRDAKGQKMSKSKGNVIDPLTMIDEYGADAFRFALTAQAGSTRDLKISRERVAGYSRFVNKLWNAARFTLGHIKDLDEIKDSLDPISIPDKWIRSRLATVTQECISFLEEFHFDRYADKIYHFIWDEFCDWYLELIKPILYGEDKKAKEICTQNLALVFSDILKLLHPVMPFVTEEIFSKLPGLAKFIMISPFPQVRQNDINSLSEKSIERLIEIVKAVRSVRSDFGIKTSAKVSPLVKTKDRETAFLVTAYAPLLLKLMGALGIGIVEDSWEKPKDAAETIFTWGSVIVPLAGEIDLKAEKARLTSEAAQLTKDIKAAGAKLENPDYLKKAPEEVVEETRQRLQAFEIKLDSTLKSISLMEKMLED